MTLSNLTSASAGEASVSSGNRTDGTNTGMLPTSSTPATPTVTTVTVSSGQPLAVAVKRKRNLPGTPDPEAEVIALSPKTLMATNRFVCEICNKGFQRDQNLQLHRRGHNLPWKLRQRTSKEVRKRVYICPEPSCVHHDPSRALGDLTGIKKHFCRKHGEKKWKCDKCSKRYAVQSDWKAHSKTCGTREYRCDCGTLFSRRDSFITHRAFCDALAEDSARVSAGKQGGGQPDSLLGSGSSSMSVIGAPSSPHVNNVGRMNGEPLASMVPLASRPGGMPQSMVGLSDLGESCHPLLPRWGATSGSGPASKTGTGLSLWLGPGPGPGNQQQMHQLLPGSDGNSSFLMQAHKGMQGGAGLPGMNTLDYEMPQAPRHSSGHLPLTPSGSLFAHLLASGNGQGLQASSSSQSGATTGMDISGFSDFSAAGANRIDSGSATAGLSSTSSAGMASNASSRSTNGGGNLSSVSPLFNPQHQQQQHTASAQMSATALLQKAAQMGATASNTSLFRGFGQGGTDSDSMGIWQGQRQEQQPQQQHLAQQQSQSQSQPQQHQHQQQGRTGDLPLNNMSNMGNQPLMRRPGDLQSVSQGLGGSSLGQTNNFGGVQGRLSESSTNVQDFMNSLSGGAGMFGGPFGSMPSMFGPSSTNMGGMLPPSTHRMSPSDVLAGSTFPGGGQGVFQGMSSSSSLLPGLGGSSRVENDSSDRFTRDFLGVGGASGITAAGGGMGRTLSPRDLARITSLGPGVDLGVFFNQRENLRSVNASGHSPGKSWDPST